MLFDDYNHSVAAIGTVLQDPSNGLVYYSCAAVASSCGGFLVTSEDVQQNTFSAIRMLPLPSFYLLSCSHFSILDTQGVASSNESYNVGIAVSSPVFLHLFCKYAIPDLAETGLLSESTLKFLIENLLKIFEYDLWKDLEQYVVPAISKHAKLQKAFAKHSKLWQPS